MGVKIVAQLEHDQLPSVPVAEVAGIANRPAIAGGIVRVVPSPAARCEGRFGTSISSPPGAVTYELARGHLPYMPNRARRTAVTASAGPLTSTCAAR